MMFLQQRLCYCRKRVSNFFFLLVVLERLRDVQLTYMSTFLSCVCVGDSVVFKWLLLSEVLLCSERMVRLRSSSGTAHEAKAQCLEALKLATKLHTLSQ